MKNLYSIGVAILFASLVFAQEKVREYKKELSELQNWCKNITNDKFCEEHFTLKEKNTNKEKKFSSLSKFDKLMFQMTITQRFNRHLEKMEQVWQDALEKNTKNKIADSKGKDDVVAGIDDLTKFIEELTKLRKEAIDSWENQANKIFEEYPKEFEENDKKIYIKTIKEFKKQFTERK